MTWVIRSASFIYDFLVGDGWELLVGLLVILPATFVVGQQSELGAGLLLLGGVAGTLSVSLLRKSPLTKRGL